MTRLAPPITLLATGLAVGAAAAPAHAAETIVGSDLAGTATIARSDPNDTVFWAAGGPAGLEVPVQGEVRAIRLKGGTVQTAEQTRRAEAFDPDYDIVHWVVLRPQADGSWRAVATSEDLVAPVIGRHGVTADTVTTLRQPRDEYRVCTQAGDRVALATVGGYVPTADGAGAPVAGFQDGLPYQVFARSGGAATDEFRAGGRVEHDRTVVSGTRTGGVELLMQAVIGSGPDARFTCRTPQEQQGAAGGRASGPLVPMAAPLLRARRLDRRGTVRVHLTCRAAGGACAGRITLRSHRRTIGAQAYALATGASGVFTVRLTREGRRFVRVASANRLRTAVVVTSAGGRDAGGIFHIRPASR